MNELSPYDAVGFLFVCVGFFLDTNGLFYENYFVRFSLSELIFMFTNLTVALIFCV